jgi:lambda repressor-like predicted transcriptional regulator
MVTDLIDRIRAALKREGVTPGGLARKAGLHRNTLYGVDRDDWNPTAAVLKALEPEIAAIEDGTWQAEPTAEAA